MRRRFKFLDSEISWVDDYGSRGLYRVGNANFRTDFGDCYILERGRSYNKRQGPEEISNSNILTVVIRRLFGQSEAFLITLKTRPTNPPRCLG